MQDILSPKLSAYQGREGVFETKETRISNYSKPMNLASLTIIEHLRGSAPGAVGVKVVDDTAAFKELEDCVTRGEAMAEAGIGCGLSRSLLAQLSECVAACDAYLAAKSRESRYEEQLKDYSVEVLRSAVALCSEEETQDSEECGNACRVFLNLLGCPHSKAVSLWS